MNVRFAMKRALVSFRKFTTEAPKNLQPTSLWQSYNKCLAEKPLITKSITSGVISFFADIMCQKYFPAEKGDKIDWKRTAKFTVLGTFLTGPLLHYWYGFLMAKIPGSGSLATLYRVAMDQLLFAPFCIIPAFFSCALLLDGTPENIPAKLKADWAPTMVANLSLWVPSQFINFRLVPAQFQVLFANVVGLFWNVYLSAQTNKALVDAPTATTAAGDDVGAGGGSDEVVEGGGGGGGSASAVDVHVHAPILHYSESADEAKEEEPDKGK